MFVYELSGCGFESHCCYLRNRAFIHLDILIVTQILGQNAGRHLIYQMGRVKSKFEWNINEVPIDLYSKYTGSNFKKKKKLSLNLLNKGALNSHNLVWNIEIYLILQLYRHYKEFYVLLRSSFSRKKPFVFFQVHSQYVFGELL